MSQTLFGKDYAMLYDFKLALLAAQPPVVVVTPPTDVSVNSVPIDTSRLVTLGHQYSQGTFKSSDLRYERFGRHLCVTAPIQEPFYLTNIAASALVPGGFSYPEYRLFVDGVQMSVAHPVASAGAFTISPTSDGWHYAEIRPYDASGNPVASPVESFAPFWYVSDAGGTAKNDPDTIAQTWSKTWFDRSQLAYNPIDAPPPAPSTTTKTVYQWARIPKSAIADLAHPLAVRPEAPFTTALPAAQITRRNLVPHRDGDTLRPAITNRGITVCENRAGYFIEDTALFKPPFPLRDGPRGVATEFFPRVVRPARNGKNFVMNPWALARYLVTGEKQTIAGWRATFNPYWEDSQTSTAWELVGDWSQVPAARRGFLDCWGWDWDERTTVQGAATNVVINGEVVHDGDVCSYATDHYGRLLELRRVGNDPNHLGTTEAATVVREVLPAGTFVDPWGVKCLAGFAYVCDRGAHAIVKVQLPNNATELATIIGNVASGAASALGTFEDAGKSLGTAQYRRFVLNPGVTTAQALALECVAPECVDIKDGFLIWSSLFTLAAGPSGLAEVRRKPLGGGAVASLCRPQVTNKTHFCTFTISDNVRGCFGPDGTIFTATFEEQQYGRPQAFLPNTPANGVLQTQPWAFQTFASYNVNRGPGPTASLVYAMAWGCAHGRLVGGSSEECLLEYSQVQPGDVASNAAQMDKGGRKFVHDGGKLVLGDHGFGFFNATMGTLQADADVTYYLSESAKP